MRAGDVEWRVAAVARFDPRAHFGQRIDHAPHWASTQGAITVDGRAKLLSREYSREQAHRRTGISGVERAAGFTKSLESRSRDPDTVAGGFYFRAEA